jgi:predicted exporter
VLWLVAGFSLVAMWPLVSGGFPALDGSTSALHPRQSLAYETSARLQEVMMAAEGGRSLLIAGDASGAAVGGLSRRLAEAERWLEGERAAGRVEAFWLPGIFWPEAELQWRRLSRLRGEMAAPETLRGALLEVGFTEASFALTAAVLSEWQRLEAGALPFFPRRDSVRWLLRRLISHDADQAVAQGWVQWVGEPAAGADYPEGVWPASWPDLGVALSGMSAVDFKRIALVFLLVLTLMLSCALRSARRVLLCLLVVGLSYLILSGLMRWLGMDWNFFSLASLLLILGTGVDYSLHVLFGLSEAGGRRAEMMRRVGKPIALCGLSTMAGFGSLGFASNVGLASLGVVCALGIGVNLLLTLVLLPHLDGWSVRSARSG